MEYQCDICGDKIKGDALIFIRHAERHITEAILQKHPEWKEKNGLCSKCVEYYKKQLKG